MRTVKQIVYAAFAQGGLSHQAIADLVREELPNSQTTARSVASMKVDYVRGGGEAKPNEERGRVKALVYAMLAEGGMTHREIADRVRELVPHAQTSHKSVASMAVDFRRAPQPSLTPDLFADYAAAMGA